MLAIETVIVPFDFSKRCRVAAEDAEAIARRFGAKLVFLHVIPYSSYEYAAFEGGAYVGTAWPSEAEVRAKLEGEVASILGGHGNEVGWEVLVEKGDPPGKIEEASRRYPTPLIAMPTHGFGRFRRFVLGSVATKVLHDAECPVYTGAHLEERPGASAGTRRVACAVDLREHSEEVLAWAWGYARRWSAPLTVIHAIDWLESAPLEKELFTPKLTEALQGSAERDARALIARTGCEAELRIEIESAAELVPSVIRESGADVLVIGRSLERGMAGRLRERAFELIRHSPVPVISV